MQNKVKPNFVKTGEENKIDKLTMSLYLLQPVPQISNITHITTDYLDKCQDVRPKKRYGMTRHTIHKLTPFWRLYIHKPINHQHQICYWYTKCKKRKEN